MGSGFSKRKKQARAMQEQFAQMQEEIAAVEVEGSAGNGLVTLKLNGDNELLDLKIKPECVDPDDIEGLEDLIKSAYQKAQEALKEKTSSGALPGMPDLSSFGL